MQDLIYVTDQRRCFGTETRFCTMASDAVASEACRLILSFPGGRVWVRARDTCCTLTHFDVIACILGSMSVLYAQLCLVR